MRHRKNLSTRQRLALDALLVTPTVTAAAKKAGLARATVYRYLQEEAFAEVYRRERALLVDQSIAAMQKIGTEAVVVLREAFKDENPHVRIRAASRVLAFMFKGVETVEFEERLRVLEAVADEQDW